MSGRPRKIRSIQSYINHSDANNGLSMLKSGMPPKVGVTRNFWHNFQTQSTPGPLSFNNTPEYYDTKQTRTYYIGILRPSFHNRPI